MWQNDTRETRDREGRGTEREEGYRDRSELLDGVCGAGNFLSGYLTPGVAGEGCGEYDLREESHGDPGGFGEDAAPGDRP